MLFRAFTTYVRSLREYNSPVWSPRYTYLINKFESVQRGFTKRLKGFGHLSYTESVDRLNAETLVELRRLKSDLTIMFCVICGFAYIDCDYRFTMIDCETSHTRGHILRLFKGHCNQNCRNVRLSVVIMAALWYKAGHYIFALLFLSSSIFLSFFFSSPNLSGCILDVYHTSTHGVALVRI